MDGAKVVVVDDEIGARLGEDGDRRSRTVTVV